MNKIETLKQVAESIGGRFYDDYSGRGMFGARCASIYCDDDDACIEAAAAAGVTGARRDRMGLGYVVYWPQIRAEE